MFEKTNDILHNIVMKAIILAIIGIFAYQVLYADQCEDWFKKTKAAEDENCLSKCLVSKKDLSDFLCSQKCESFCSDSPSNTLSILNYYGLTKEEISFCSEHRLTCLSAYRLTWRAESLCNEIYNQSSVNDESDACRHYVWSILLSREIGMDYAMRILHAHEANPNESTDEQKMDIDNNKAGIDYFNRLTDKNLTDVKIMSSFKEAVHSKKLVVLKPKYQNKGGLP